VERTSEEKVVAGLSHLAYLLNWLGLVATVVVFAMYRQKSAYVAEHAKQSLGLQVIALVLGSVIRLLTGVGSVGFLGLGMLSSRAFVGSLYLGLGLLSLLGLVAAILACTAAIKAFMGKEHRHPLFGEFVARMAA